MHRKQPGGFCWKQADADYQRESRALAREKKEWAGSAGWREGEIFGIAGRRVSQRTNVL